MSKAVLYIFTYVIWILLTWPFNPLNLQDIITGLLVSAVAVILFGRDISRGKSVKPDIRRAAWAAAYIPVLIYYMIIANFDLLYRIISPSRPIKPGIIRINTELKHPVARALLCNSITLTPGTLTVDMKENKIYVHWINMTTTRSTVAARKIAGRFENILKRVFE